MTSCQTWVKRHRGKSLKQGIEKFVYCTAGCYISTVQYVLEQLQTNFGTTCWANNN
jgi:hypothetical protein